MDASPAAPGAVASLIRLKRYYLIGEGDRLNTPNDWMTLLVVAVIFGVVNAVIWPVVFWLTLSLTLATLGLFVLVINALMFLLTSRITKTLGLGFRVDGFVPAFAGALVMSIVSLLLNYFLAANW